MSAAEVETLLRAAKQPAIQIYPGDWMRDNVAGCSPDAQALWLRMMFVMHDAKPYGHLVEAGAPMRTVAVARRCGFAPREYERALEELLSAGVPRVTQGDEYRELLSAVFTTKNDDEVEVDLSPLGVPNDDVIFSLRMVRDHRLRVIRKLIGTLGGNPNLVKQSEIQVNQASNQTPRARALRAGMRAEDENEVGSFGETGAVTTEGVQGEPSATFEEAWEIYPRKKGKHEAQRHYKAQVRSRGDHAALMSAIRNYLREIEILGTDEQHTSYGSTFFNNLWRDFVDGAWKPPQPRKIQPVGPKPLRSVPSSVPAEVQALIDKAGKAGAR